MVKEPWGWEDGPTEHLDSAMTFWQLGRVGASRTRSQVYKFLKLKIMELFYIL